MINKVPAFENIPTTGTFPVADKINTHTKKREVSSASFISIANMPPRRSSSKRACPH